MLTVHGWAMPIRWMGHAVWSVRFIRPVAVISNNRNKFDGWASDFLFCWENMLHGVEWSIYLQATVSQSSRDVENWRELMLSADRNFYDSCDIWFQSICLLLHIFAKHGKETEAGNGAHLHSATQFEKRNKPLSSCCFDPLTFPLSCEKDSAPAHKWTFLADQIRSKVYTIDSIESSDTKQMLGSRLAAVSNASSFTHRLCVSLLPAISLVVAPDFIDRDAFLFFFIFLEPRKRGSFGIDRQLKVQVKCPEDGTTEWILNNESHFGNGGAGCGISRWSGLKRTCRMGQIPN